MKTLHLSTIISLCIILSTVTLLQNANATVPLIEIIIPGGANDRNCGNACFIPQNITVPQGAAVEWINKDLVPHTVVSGKPRDQDNGILFDSGSIWMGKSFIYNFNDVGTFHYFDKSHPWKTGIITVTGDSTIPPNAIRTPNGGWVTPVTRTNNGTKLNIHYEVGTPVYGKVPPPVPNFITQYMLSPLQQFKSGIAAQDIKCKESLFLVIRSYEHEPVCLKAGTISKLASRGLLYGINANDLDLHYTTIVIPPGSENQNSNKTYSPDIVMVTIGINNTVRWLNQADVANSIVADNISKQNDKMFNSFTLKPGQSYEFTFTQPGTYPYHGEPHPWQRGTVIVSLTSENTTLPASFEPCNTPYPQSNTGVSVLYMPVNSIAEICVRYSNPDDTPYPIGIRIFDANNMNKNATGITTWDSSGNNTISKGNSTIVYVINTGNQTGFYGLAFFCNGSNPFAVGYDSNSAMTTDNFPFLRETLPCPLQSYQFHIDSLSGIGVKHISYP